MARVSLDQKKRWEAFQKTLASPNAPEKKRPASRKSDAEELEARKRSIRRQFASRGKDVAELTVAELVKLYGSGGGGDDAAGPELKGRGTPAREELIRMLDAIPASSLRRDSPKVGNMVEILQYKFPSSAAYKALERLDARLRTRGFRRGCDASLAEMRTRIKGQSPWGLDNKKSQCERSLEHDEVLLANCRPADRMWFLIEAANSALEAFEEACRLKLPKLQAADQAKVAKYARELLAIKKVAGTSGHGVYYGNHVLGMLALRQGDLASAKSHLIEASKAPVSWQVKELEPDFTLAEQLLEKGEREAVCAYLDNLKAAANSVKRSPKRDALLEGWAKRIRAGKGVEFREWITKVR
jgi:hypothetical protein